jgi:cobaltochelatase CobS
MSSSERTELKRTLSALSDGTKAEVRSAFSETFNSGLTFRQNLDRMPMAKLRSIATALGLEVTGTTTTHTKEKSMTAEADVAQEATPVKATAKADTGSGIEVKKEFEASIDPLLSLATGGRVTSIRQIINTMTALNERSEMAKSLEAEVARLTREMKTRPTPVATKVSAKSDGSIPSGNLVYKRAKDIFVSPSGAKSDKLDFDIPFFEWDAPHPMVPDIDPNYIFRIEHLLAFLFGLTTGKNTWLYGHTGTGKTTFVEQVAARIGYPVMRVNMDNDIERSDFLGSTVLLEEKGATVSKFVEGVLPKAMQQPCILLVDEMDFGKSGIMYVMQRALESKGLLLTEDHGRLVTPHENFRIVATANTRGQGDEYGCYPGARVQSNALLDRFTVWLHVDYMNEKEEKALLTSSYPTLDKTAVDQLTLFAKEIRKAFTNRELLMSISPRSLLSIAESSMFYGYLLPAETAMKLAIETTFIEKATDDTKAKVVEIANRCFKAAK